MEEKKMKKYTITFSSPSKQAIEDIERFALMEVEDCDTVLSSPVQEHEVLK
jgi:hypothetical protein